MFIPNWQELCIQGHILLTLGRVNICMPDLFSLKHRICVHIDMINAIMVHCGASFYHPIRWADSFEYLDLTMKMLAFLILLANYCLGQRSTNISRHQNHPERLLKHRFLGPAPRGSDSVGLGNGLRFCISISFQVVLMLLVQGPHFDMV